MSAPLGVILAGRQATSLGAVRIAGRPLLDHVTDRLGPQVAAPVQMGIPVLASRSGFTAWGVEIARQVGLTLIGRMRGQRFICLSGENRLIRDTDIAHVPDEDRKHRRKGAEG